MQNAKITSITENTLIVGRVIEKVSIKKYIIQYIEQRPKFLKKILKLTNRLSRGEKNLIVSNIHFINNKIYILEKKYNQLVFAQKSYMRNSKMYIKGNQNIINIGSNTILVGNSVSQMFYMDGKENLIIIGKNCKVNDTTFFIWGNNNTIILEDNCSTMKTEFHIEQNNNTIHIGEKCTFHGRNGYPIHIAVDEGSKVMVDSDCMFANGIQIRSTDSHSIIDLTGKRINPAKDIYIGKHCWLGLGAIILKGTNILPHTVVGAGTVCSRKYEQKNCILAGNPAKVVKREIDWDRSYL